MANDHRVLSPAPRLCLGIDIGKTHHTVGFVSADLLARHGHFSACPTTILSLSSRQRLDTFLDELARHVPLAQCAALFEYTGHYHQTLQEALLARGLPVYIISVHGRKTATADKTDKADALRLANLLYGQLVLGAQVDDPACRACHFAPPGEAAAQLVKLVRRRHELMQDVVRHKNKLIALADQVFPELTSICRDPNIGFALALRERFPTPADVAAAPFDDLCRLRLRSRPGDTQLRELQRLAATSLGLRQATRLSGLVLEQSQLIAELRLLTTHLDALESRITTLIESSREGQILLSFGCIGPLAAGAILASIGNITNFDSPAKLKKFCGWAPQSTQTGISLDRVSQTRGGTRLMKHTLYMVALRAVREEGPWKQLYERLVPLKCSYDSRTGRYRGKLRIIGRVAGQITELIYYFLRRDARLLASTPTGATPAAPTLYDPAIHAAKRHTASSPPLAGTALPPPSP